MKKQKEFDAGVMSFDSFFGEAGRFNELKEAPREDYYYEDEDQYYYDYNNVEDRDYEDYDL